MDVKKCALLVCSLIVTGAALEMKGATNPYYIYKSALLESESTDESMKRFLAATWNFLPEVTERHIEAKAGLKKEFAEKFGPINEVKITIPPSANVEPFCVSVRAQLQNDIDNMKKGLAQCEQAGQTRQEEFQDALDKHVKGLGSLDAANQVFVKSEELLKNAFIEYNAVDATATELLVAAQAIDKDPSAANIDAFEKKLETAKKTLDGKISELFGDVKDELDKLSKRLQAQDIAYNEKALEIHINLVKMVDLVGEKFKKLIEAAKADKESLKALNESLKSLGINVVLKPNELFERARKAILTNLETFGPREAAKAGIPEGFLLPKEINVAQELEYWKKNGPALKAVFDS